jgi:uncharacterized protein YqeY
VRKTTTAGDTMWPMPDALKDRLRSDLTAAMRARDAVRAGTIRMALTAVTSEEKAGDAARELSDDEVVGVLGKEAKKRRESATAYDDAGRPELADRERAELAVLTEYLPEQLDDDEIAAIVTEEVAAAGADGATGMPAMGRVMKAVQSRVAGRADGKRVAAEVRARLTA